MTPSKITIKWTFKEAMSVMAGFLCVNGVLLLLATIHAEKGVFDFLISDNQTVNVIMLYTLSALTFLSPLYFFAIRGKGIKLKDLGVKSISLWEAIHTIFVGYGFLVLFTIMFAVIIYFGGDLPGVGLQKDILPIFGKGRLAVITASIIAIVIAPVIEEIFFRGFLLQSLMSKFPFYVATTVTSAIFALVHFQFESITRIFILSLLINYLFKMNGNSTTATIIFHMVNNAVALLIITNIKIPGLIT